MLLFPTQLYQFYQSKFERDHQLKDLLSVFSVYVWETLKFATHESSEISKTDERELTNQLVRSIAQVIRQNNIPLPIRLFHAPKENLNGADLDIVFRLDNNICIKLFCQAKRLYVEKAKRNNLKSTYSMLDHEVNGELQINLLLEYAKRNKAIPLYMLYNFTDFNEICSLKSIEKEQFGCTLINANFLKDTYLGKVELGKLKFQDLYPIAQPLITICEIIKQDKNIIKDIWGKSDNQSDNIFSTFNEVMRDKLWYELGTTDNNRFVTSVNLEKLFENTKQLNNNHVYNPKFRIVFDLEPISHRKINFNL
jgi:hypothetical protein